jgi:diadenosine tetraphosphate (Ap4A) HIT family hydrolase|tara:strand:- start:808 stop:1143 length:336 start_codon:yes stop_codon:yes gene_type:complete
MIYDNKNIFAKILRGEMPCDKIYEDEFILSFKDISPQAKIHILIIPKDSYIDVADFLQNADSQYQTNFWQSVNKIIDNLDLRLKGFQIKTHKGKDGGQEVFHFHLHLLSNS